MKKTKLIVCENLADLQNKRQELIKKYEKGKNFVKWSDTAVELTDQLIILKVVNIPPTVVDSLKGYDDVELNQLEQQIDNFVNEIKEIAGLKDPKKDKTPSEATQAPERGTKVDEGVKYPEGSKNREKPETKDKNKQNEV